MLSRWIPRPDEVLLVLRGGRWTVSRQAVTAFPRLHRVEPMSTAPTEIEVIREVRSHDGERVELRARVRLRAAGDDDDLLRIAQRLGAAGASDPAHLAAVVGPRVSSALGIAAAARVSEALRRAPGELAEDIRALLDQPEGLTVERIVVEPLVERLAMSAGPFR